jgi:hypothetical protein
MIAVKGTLDYVTRGWCFRLDFTNPAEPMPQFRSEGYFKTQDEAVSAAETVVKRRYHPVVKIDWEE